MPQDYAPSSPLNLTPSHTVAVTVSYGQSVSAQPTRSTHLLTFTDIAQAMSEDQAKSLADRIVAGILASGFLCVYREDFPNQLNPNPKVN